MSWTSPFTVASTTFPCTRPEALLVLHVRLEVRDRTLHRARALHDLRQEHLPGAEEVADDLHARHERAFDDVERPRQLLPRLLCVLLDEVDDPVHERVLEPLLDRRLAPREVALAPGAFAAHALGVLDEPLGRVGAPVEDDVLDALEQIRLDVLVHDELAGVHDAHVEAGRDRVVEERRVHRLSDGVVAAEREAQVRDAAARLRAGAALLDERERLDERLRVLRVLLDARRHREHVRVEDDVLRREPDLVDEQPVGALADRDLPLDRVGLALLVERHDDDAGAVAAHGARLLEERLLPLLQAERVDDALALQALEAGLRAPTSASCRP